MTLQRKLTASDIFLIVANLLPLYGVWFEGWDPKQMFLVYCLETIIIGGYNILKMVMVTLYKKRDYMQNHGSRTLITGWFFILFFIIHYGFFVLIQTGIFAGVSGFKKDGSSGMLTFLPGIFSYMDDDARLVLYIFITMYGARTLFDFILNGRYHKISLGLLMFQPYGRILVQQFAVILGSIFLAFGAGKIFMLIFVVIKIWFEVFLNFDRYLEKEERLQLLKNMIDKRLEAAPPKEKKL